MTTKKHSLFHATSVKLLVLIVGYLHQQCELALPPPTNQPFAKTSYYQHLLVGTTRYQLPGYRHTLSKCCKCVVNSRAGYPSLRNLSWKGSTGQGFWGRRDPGKSVLLCLWKCGTLSADEKVQKGRRCMRKLNEAT